jgi:hypothetical protein
MTREQDFDNRAREIIKDLSKDGYPEVDQFTIVTGTLCMLLANSCENVEQLREGISVAKESIDMGAKACFEIRKHEGS